MRQLAIAFALCLPTLALTAEASVGEIRACLQGEVALELQGIGRDEIDVTLMDVADAETRMLVGETKVFGWPEERSTEDCLS